jgi:FAD/FMN-containing dehydrogenase
VAIELINPPTAEHITRLAGIQLASGRSMLIVAFEENADAVKWQLEQLRQVLHPMAAPMESADGELASEIGSALVENQSLPGITFKANFRSSAAVQFLDELSGEPIPWGLQVHAGNGVAYGHALPPPTLDTQKQWTDPCMAGVRDSLARLRSLAVRSQGNLVVQRCPTDWKSEIPVWGEPRGDAWLMRAIKRKLDPHNVLNPGRFVE